MTDTTLKALGVTLVVGAALTGRWIYRTVSNYFYQRRLRENEDRLLQKARELEAQGGDVRSIKRRQLNLHLGVSERDEPFRVTGYQNMGNTCFMNSVLQAVASVPAAELYLRNLLERTKNDLFVFTTLRTIAGQVSEPSAFYALITGETNRFGTWNQEDAQELFLAFIDVLEQRASRATALTSTDDVLTVASRDEPNASAKASVDIEKTMQGAEGFVESRVMTLLDVEKDDIAEAASLIVAAGGETSAKACAFPTQSAHYPRSDERRSVLDSKGNHATTLHATLTASDGVDELVSPFHGTEVTFRRCLRCGYSRPLSFSQFTTLTLSLGGVGGPTSLEKLLNDYTNRETLNDVRCEFCSAVATLDLVQDVIDELRSKVEADVKRRLVQRIVGATNLAAELGANQVPHNTNQRLTEMATLQLDLTLAKLMLGDETSISMRTAWKMACSRAMLSELSMVLSCRFSEALRRAILQRSELISAIEALGGTSLSVLADVPTRGGTSARSGGLGVQRTGIHSDSTDNPNFRVLQRVVSALQNERKWSQAVSYESYSRDAFDIFDDALNLSPRGTNMDLDESMELNGYEVAEEESDLASTDEENDEDDDDEGVATKSGSGSTKVRAYAAKRASNEKLHRIAMRRARFLVATVFSKEALCAPFGQPSILGGESVLVPPMPRTITQRIMVQEMHQFNTSRGKPRTKQGLSGLMSDMVTQGTESIRSIFVGSVLRAQHQLKQSARRQTKRNDRTAGNGKKGKSGHAVPPVSSKQHVAEAVQLAFESPQGPIVPSASVKGDIMSQHLLAKMPQVLTIHLSRLIAGQKLTTPVRFPLVLDLTSQHVLWLTQSAARGIAPSHVVSMDVQAEFSASALGVGVRGIKTDRPVRYRLRCVVEHLGGVGGHYVAYRRHYQSSRRESLGRGRGIEELMQEEGATIPTDPARTGDFDPYEEEPDAVWTRVSDDKVVPITVDRVLSCEAYLLYYQRIE